MKKTILIYILVFFTISSAQNLPVISIKNKAVGVCGTPLLSEEYIKDALEKTRTLYPEVYNKIVTLNKINLDFSTFDIGDSTTFYALNVKNQVFYTLVAELKAKNNQTNIWVEKEEIRNGNVTNTEISAIFNALTVSTPSSSLYPDKGILEIENLTFGSPPNKDGDNIVDFLILDIKDSFDNIENFIYLAGYFLPNDQTNNYGSNKRDIMYIDSYPGIKNPNMQQRDTYTVITTTAHEFQHLIHYNYDTNEDKFLNEGLSQFAQILTGYQFDNPEDFFDNTNISLYTFNTDEELVDYYKAQMFVLYLYEQFGADFLRSVIQNTENGTSSIDDELTKGYSRNYIDILTDWGIANYMNNYSFDSRYGYLHSTASQYSAYPHVNITEFPYDNPLFNINGAATRYISFSAAESLKVTFSGSNINVKGIVKNSDPPQVFDVPLNQEIEINDIGVNYNEIVFSMTNYFNYTKDISIESNGIQNIFYIDKYYDNGEPDPETGPYVLTMTSGHGFAVRFTPPGSGSTLVSARMYMYSDQTGNDVIFHVWEIENNGEPGDDIITPFRITLNENFHWVDIDLSDYSDVLNNLENDIFVGFLQDDSDISSIGLDSNNPNTHHTYYRFSTTGWKPFHELHITTNTGQVSMSPFDAMVRLKFSYLDPTAPVLSTGVVQNPVYTENFDIYVIGEKELNLNSLSGTISINSDTYELSFVKSGSSGKVFADNTISFLNSGTAHVYISGSNKMGILRSTSELDFNVQVFDYNSDNSIRTLDDVARLSFKEGALKKNVVVSSFINMNENHQVSYTFQGPSQELLLNDNPVIIEFKLPQNHNSEIVKKYFIERLAGNQWEKMNTIVQTDKYLKAESAALGEFRLVESEEEFIIPKKYILYQNFPNPFNSGTSIKYELKKGTKVRLEIYNLLGQKVKTLVSEIQDAGIYTVTWDGKNDLGQSVSSDIYIYRLLTDEFNSKLKMILLK